MTSPVITVTPDTDFKAVAQLLRGYNIGAVPVVDSEQHVVGIVSEADLIAKASWKRTHQWTAPALAADGGRPQGGGDYNSRAHDTGGRDHRVPRPASMRLPV